MEGVYGKYTKFSGIIEESAGILYSKGMQEKRIKTVSGSMMK